jgi:hypothetical protein
MTAGFGPQRNVYAGMLNQNERRPVPPGYVVARPIQLQWRWALGCLQSLTDRYIIERTEDARPKWVVLFCAEPIKTNCRSRPEAERFAQEHFNNRWREMTETL